MRLVSGALVFMPTGFFLTPRYLSTLVRQASGRTVMDWVNEAVMQEAKLMLRHTDKLVYQIADELNFPNASFFSKYFRRMAGMTPNDLSKKGRIREFRVLSGIFLSFHGEFCLCAVIFSTGIVKGEALTGKEHKSAAA